MSFPEASSVVLQVDGVLIIEVSLEDGRWVARLVPTGGDKIPVPPGKVYCISFKLAQDSPDQARFAGPMPLQWSGTHCPTCISYGKRTSDWREFSLLDNNIAGVAAHYTFRLIVDDEIGPQRVQFRDSGSGSARGATYVDPTIVNEGELSGSVGGPGPYISEAARDLPAGHRTKGS